MSSGRAGFCSDFLDFKRSHPNAHAFRHEHLFLNGGVSCRCAAYYPERKKEDDFMLAPMNNTFVGKEKVEDIMRYLYHIGMMDLPQPEGLEVITFLSG
jgi:hypothetical protein